jgi:hypothetical protein
VVKLLPSLGSELTTNNTNLTKVPGQCLDAFVCGGGLPGNGDSTWVSW